MGNEKRYFPALNDIMTAEHTLSEILSPTPLIHNRNLSDKFGAEIMLKREDLQAFNIIPYITLNCNTF